MNFLKSTESVNFNKHQQNKVAGNDLYEMRVGKVKIECPL